VGGAVGNGVDSIAVGAFSTGDAVGRVVRRPVEVERGDGGSVAALVGVVGNSLVGVRAGAVAVAISVTRKYFVST
jgi:hypothetical protein